MLYSLWLNWLPWRVVVRRVARAYGFVDPIAVLGKLHGFSQPSEVAEPFELLRAGVVFHARGLMNTHAIQHNLDWVWPYWVERQFNPEDVSFIPRAFSVTHVNLTHRNWTAVGIPSEEPTPIIDPHGLVTPFWDGWSLDFWLVKDDGLGLIPSRAVQVQQTLTAKENLEVSTIAEAEGMRIHSVAQVTRDLNNKLFCTVDIAANATDDSWLVVSLRPYNPEGVSFIHQVNINDNKGWTVDGKGKVEVSEPFEKGILSTYRDGDVFSQLQKTISNHVSSGKSDVTCDVGMVTAAALYRCNGGTEKKLNITVPLGDATFKQTHAKETQLINTWTGALQEVPVLTIPDQLTTELYKQALYTLILLSPEEIYPGPFTYKRFWFRDAVYISYALLCANLSKRVERVFPIFLRRQTRKGYFHSQEGEWDSNGQVLWLMEQFYSFTDSKPTPVWLESIISGAEWIRWKRGQVPASARCKGLLPAGFSAEHLGPSDFYFWDDFWAVAGLHSAAKILRSEACESEASRYEREAEDLTNAIENALEAAHQRLETKAMPAAPLRRMDAGAIGSIVAGYPLQLVAANDPRLLATVEFLLDKSSFKNAFFQDMTHSGVNPYLTLHMAQILLRAEDARYFMLMDRVAQLATPTGQWPEAIHPHTGGGCMGDGQHAWAAAEWLLMIRNCFVREEDGRLILVQGVPEHWLKSGEPTSFGPAATLFGAISIRLETNEDSVLVSWDANWHRKAPVIEVRLPGFTPTVITDNKNRCLLTRKGPA